MATPSDLPLRGHSVVVCRPEAQARSLVDRLTTLGAQVVRLPLIEIVPPEDTSRLDDCVARIADVDWVCATSSNGVDAVVASLDRTRTPWPATAQLAAVGDATCRAAEAAGLTVDFVPSEATARCLAEELPLDLSSDRPPSVLAPLAELAGPDLLTVLTDRGARVEAVTAYRSITPTHPPDLLANAAAADAVLLTSGSTVDRFLAAIGPDPVPDVMVAIGPSTAAVLREHGRSATIIADPHNEDGLIAALVRSLSS